MDIKNKVVIVTGGTGGIGFATVRALLKNDAKHVAIFDLESTKDRATTCLQKIEKEFGREKASYHVCDVTKEKEFEVLYDKLMESQKVVDILINNAGMFNDKNGNRMIDVNVKGVVNGTLTAIERMGTHKKGKGGTVLNVGSVVSLIPSPGFPIYVATKYAVYGFTKSLQEHYKNIGVRILAICPGVTQTNFLEQDWEKDCLPFVSQKFLDDLKNCSDIIQPPENVAEAIIKMIKEGKSDDVWVSDENEPPYSVKEPTHYKNRKIPV